MRKTSVINNLRGGWVLFLILFLYAKALFAQVAEYSLAVIPGAGDRIVDERFISSLETSLSDAPNIKLLERTLIQDVLTEQRISETGFNTETKLAVRLGQLLSADFLLFASRVPNDELLIYSLSIVESRTGIVLRSWMSQHEIQTEDIQHVIDEITLFISKRQQSEAEIHYVGILQIKNEELGSALDGISQSLETLLGEALAKSPEVMMLDRDHMQYLLQEQTLTGLETNLKSSAIVIEGGIKYTVNQEKISVNLTLRHLDLAMVENTISMELPAKNMNFEMVRATLVKKILETLNVKSTETKFSDPQKESDLFLRQVPLNLAGGEYDLAIRNAEVALAFNSNQETRYWAARAWYALSQSLRRKSELIKTIITRVKRVDINNQVIEQSGADTADPELLEQMLSAALRAHTLIEEITKVHMANPSGSVIPDPLDGFDIYEINVSPRDYPPLKTMIDTQDARIKRYLPLLIDVCFGYIGMQRDYYSSHYSQSVDAQNAYWDTWLKEKYFINDYYGYYAFDPSRQTKMIGMAFTASAQFMPYAIEPRIKGLSSLIKLQEGTTLAAEEITLYEVLHSDKDPVVRLLADKQLIRQNHWEASRNMLKNFSDNFIQEKEIWSFADIKFIPSLLRAAIHRLAVSDRRALLEYGQPIYEYILKEENIRLLIVWSSLDVFWPYVNSLVLEHKEEEALNVIRQAITTLEKHQNDLSSEEEKDARLLRLQLEIKLDRLGVKSTVLPDLIQHSYSMNKPSYIRLRPEIEAPYLDDPIDISLFPAVPATPHGLHTATFNRSKTIYTEDGGGDVFSMGYTRSIDAEGNEQYTTYNLDVETEKEKDLNRSSDAWGRYSIEYMPTHLTAAKAIDPRYLTETASIVGYNHWLDDKNMYIIQEKRRDNNLIVSTFEHNLFDPSASRELGVATVPIKDQQSFYVTAITGDDQHIYVGTSSGLLIFKKGSGEKVDKVETIANIDRQYEPYISEKSNQESNPIKGDIRYIHENNGFPDDRILSLAAYEGKIYAGIGPLRETADSLVGDCGLVAYDPQTGTYELLASSRSLEKHNPLEGGVVYQISTIITDASRGALWLAVNGNAQLNGIWRFNLSTRQFEHMVPEDLAIQSMQWVGNKIVYIMYGSGFAQYDPQSEEKVWLLGYVVSAYSGPSRPLPPKGLGGDPVHGYSKTRLWPFTMVGDDLFTLSWDLNNVILHHKGKESSEKSILNPRSSAVSSKRFLASNQYGAWIVTYFGEVYRLTLKDNLTENEKRNGLSLSKKH